MIKLDQAFRIFTNEASAIGKNHISLMSLMLQSYAIALNFSNVQAQTSSCAQTAVSKLDNFSEKTPQSKE